MTQLLMPQATAVWLVDNTTLTFAQIADLCGMHELEVQGIADGEVAANIVGQDPVRSGQIDKGEIERCEADPTRPVALRERENPPRIERSKARYTPVAKRRDKPDAIAYLIDRHPRLSDARIVRLIGTTKRTVAQIRAGEHRNSGELEPKDPVSLGLCSAEDLDAEVGKADAEAMALERNLARARAELASREAAERKSAGGI